MWEIPDHINALKPVGISEIDGQIEGLVDSLKAFCQDFLSEAPDMRKPVFVSVHIVMRDGPGIEVGDDTYQIVIDSEGRFWDRWASETYLGWSHSDKSFLGQKYGIRYRLRQSIKDFLNYPVVIDADAERDLRIELMDPVYRPIAPLFAELPPSWQKSLGINEILKDFTFED